MNNEISHHREFLKDNIRQMVDFSQTPQNRRVPPPPIEKPIPESAETILRPRHRPLHAGRRIRLDSLRDLLAREEEIVPISLIRPI